MGNETEKKIRVWPGSPYPLGATWDGAGVNFSIFSENATRAELCLFESPQSSKEYARIPVIENTDRIWHCYLPEAKPGLVYGYRVYGPHDPEKGLRFNPYKITLDPYARAIARYTSWSDEMFGYRIKDERADLSCDERDSAPFVPLAAVIDSSFDWKGDNPPKIPWNKTIIYELHIKGFTKRNPLVPEELRGTYAALGSAPVIAYLKDLGVTSVELMPCHHRIDDRHLVDMGLVNFWGYNTLAFFAPDMRYASVSDPQGVVAEFKRMVMSFHKAGMEVILDVVYNHTAEGNHMGPTLSFRGIDNGSYYRLVADNRRYYMDFTGCGNTLNMQHPRVLQLIMDSLRYWITEMHVDGFRFDLASALARELYDVDKLGSFFDVICQDPVISRAKLVAEPWDLGHGGYQVGNFPVGWTEWNGKYRDTVRRFWKGDGSLTGELATRLCGSSDLYEQSGRRPYASINFITCHDGFTLHDLVSYNYKHNEANGENNADGSNDNASWNCGVEGPTGDPAISELRERQKRNFLATLFLSQGVPMLLSGDETGFSRQGNNNAYCQDNELNWIEWELSDAGKDLLDFTRRLIRLRREQVVFRRRKFFQGRLIRGSDIKDIVWLDIFGRELSDEAWISASLPCLGVMLSGDAMTELDEYGERLSGDTVLLYLSASASDMTLRLPEAGAGFAWELTLDTRYPKAGFQVMVPGDEYLLSQRSFIVFIRVRNTNNGGKG